MIFWDINAYIQFVLSYDWINLRLSWAGLELNWDAEWIQFRLIYNSLRTQFGLSLGSASAQLGFSYIFFGVSMHTFNFCSVMIESISAQFDLELSWTQLVWQDHIPTSIRKPIICTVWWCFWRFFRFSVFVPTGPPKASSDEDVFGAEN